MSGDGYAHCLVHLLRRELAVDLLHSLARPLHGRQRFSVDVRRLDGVYLLLERADLCLRLLQAVLVGLLAPQRRFRHYRAKDTSASVNRQARGRTPPPPASPRAPTVLVGVDVLPCYGLLLVHLCLQVPLPLLQHVQLGPEAQDGVLGAVFPLLRGPSAKPAPDARHVDGGRWSRGRVEKRWSHGRVEKRFRGAMMQDATKAMIGAWAGSLEVG